MGKKWLRTFKNQPERQLFTLALGVQDTGQGFGDFIALFSYHGSNKEQDLGRIIFKAPG